MWTREQINSALDEAKWNVMQSDKIVQWAASIMVNRLKSGGVCHWQLKDLKKELAKYNVNNHVWKE